VAGRTKYPPKLSCFWVNDGDGYGSDIDGGTDDWIASADV